MIATGIVDPTKVVRTALTDASSVAALLITAFFATDSAVPTTTPIVAATTTPRSQFRLDGGEGGGDEAGNWIRDAAVTAIALGGEGGGRDGGLPGVVHSESDAIIADSG